MDRTGVLSQTRDQQAFKSSCSLVVQIKVT